MVENLTSDRAENDAIVRNWLHFLALLIIVMVVVGGATRLTDSGLSITEWAPISGFIPPLSIDHWQSEFLAYQTTDEFKYQNSAMTLDQFKVIYWWEWGHRFLGRLIGLAILLPMIYFWVRGRLDKGLKIPALIIFALVCFQGALGWWMVKSGLVNRVDVSQIRLAVHLTTACIFFAYVVWVARSLTQHTEAAVPSVAWQGIALLGLAFIQIFVGGLVAGLDAGMAYNTWPKMNGEWVPHGLLAASPAWVNFTDNALTVQFVHRITAYALWIAVFVHAIYMWRAFPGTTHARRAAFFFVLISGQALVGIITLLMQVPMSWALLHQFGGVAIVGFATAHWYALKPHKQKGFETSARAVNTANATALG